MSLVEMQLRGPVPLVIIRKGIAVPFCPGVAHHGPQVAGTEGAGGAALIEAALELEAGRYVDEEGGGLMGIRPRYVESLAVVLGLAGEQVAEDRLREGAGRLRNGHRV